MGLPFLYGTKFGRLILKLLTRPWISKTSGFLMDRGFSRCLIKGFVKKNGIDMNEYVPCKYKSFNKFFYRDIKPEMRPFDMEPTSYVAPCDGVLSVYNISDDLVIPVKQSRYSISDLLRDEEMAKQFNGGICLVYRLCVNHYHRYSFNDSGRLGEYKFIPGILHTVRPIALRHVPVFTENARECVIMDTDNYGKVAQIEVGAMLVGKIVNNKDVTTFTRGLEKGHFEYGGSTIIQLLQPGKVELPKELFDVTDKEEETPVKMGQKLGVTL